MRLKTPQEFRCQHRHTGIEHRSCYITYIQDDYPDRIGYLDIETSNLNADFGIVYTWCIKQRGGKTTYGTIKKSDFRNYPHDRRVVKELLEEMKKYDVLCTYYGTGFDIPFIRSRALKCGLIFPFYKEINHLDLYYVARNRLKLHSSRLASVCAFLGIEGKTAIDNEYWAKAVSGNDEALKYILEHNKGDVEILERVHNYLMPYMQNTRRSI